MKTTKLKPCYTTVGYYSEKLKSNQAATFVCFNRENKNLVFIQNSVDKIWININKIYLL